MQRGRAAVASHLQHDDKHSSRSSSSSAGGTIVSMTAAGAQRTAGAMDYTAAGMPTCGAQDHGFVTASRCRTHVAGDMHTCWSASCQQC
jgi:hypothetical protein